VLLAVAISGHWAAGCSHHPVAHAGLHAAYHPVAETVTTSVRELDYVERRRASGPAVSPSCGVHVLPRARPDLPSTPPA